MKTLNEFTRFEDVILDPSKFFDHPDDVVEAHMFSHKQKAEILERWKEDSLQLMRAADENMAGGEPHHLSDVEHAMEAVGNRLQGGERTGST